MSDTIPEIQLSGMVRLRMNSDGPGVRTLIGTYGCPLRCKYCINPHSWQRDATVRTVNIHQLYREISVDNLYFQTTGGGLTIGGGEPLLHMDVLEEFLLLCPDTWNLWVETSLAVDRNLVKKATDLFHHFLVDIKSLNSVIYQSYTGASGRIAYSNLKFLLETVGPERVTVRIPIIPGYSDEAQQRKDAQTLKEMGFVHIDLFTYYVPTDHGRTL